jgi:hypothetical protein
VAWWWWALLWAVLLIGSVGVFFLLGRSLFRKVKVLLAEVGLAADRLGAVANELQVLSERSEELAVFIDPSQLRQERFLAARRRDGRHSAKPEGTSRERSTGRAGQRVR